MLTPLSPEAAEQLREFFAAAGYTDRHFRQTPALRELPHWFHDLSRLLEHTREPSAWNVLLRWFVAGVPQEIEAAAGLVPEPFLALMIGCGMLAREGGQISSTVMLIPCDDFLFAADPAEHIRSGGAENTVLWPNPTTRLLQQFSVRTPCQAMLDLGTGCGIQGILAAGYSRHVVATDLNPRAEQFVRFNAWLNGVEGIECLTGDTFQPVEGRTFDLILANPPFFVTPTSGQMYCENSMDLDGYCRRVVREAPLYLNEGGYFQAVLEWVELSGQPWQERLSEWLEGSGCDAWIMRGYFLDPPAYAEQRIRSTWPAERSGGRFREWMEYYRQRGVTAIHGGMLAMRKRAGQNWLRIEELGMDITQPFGGEVLEAFATQDILSTHPSDEELLPMRPRLSPKALLEQQSRASEGRWAPASLTLRLTTGLPASLPVESEVAEFLARCDGTSTLRALTDDLAAHVSAYPDQVRQQCCRVIRRLAERRFVQLLR